ncbi:AAA family ATPase [Singulisphaera sp. Ch08]|uniref:AAA family ATPase n=1 Tax=Singulisphaera sp. Ch08 TaxID=3120278 RepID=A0AAU7CNX4_9BACT
MVSRPGTVPTNLEHFTGRTWLLPLLLGWLGRRKERVVLLTGHAGTGKSTVLSWLAGAGSVPVKPDHASQLEHLAAQVGATHFCDAAGGATDPRAFARNVARQLSDNVPGFGKALRTGLEDRVSITVYQQASSLAEGSRMVGVLLENLNLDKLSGEDSFNRLFRVPLQTLYNEGYDQPLILLVDALDEALTYTGDVTLVELLGRLADLPEQVRLILTTRPDPRVLKWYPEAKPINLVADAPPDSDDVRDYVYQRLQTLNPSDRELLTDRIAQAAQGIFLYARLILDDLLPRHSGTIGLEALRLPPGLPGLYHQFLNRELGRNENRWYDVFQPLLGVLAVAQGAGLSREQVERVVRQDVELALRVAAQYLSGFPKGPFRIFHRSFEEFLLEDAENTDYHIDAASMHRRIVTSYQRSYRDRWGEIDEYGIQHLLRHLLLVDHGGRLGTIKNDEYAIRHLFSHVLAAGTPEVIGEIVGLADPSDPQSR